MPIIRFEENNESIGANYIIVYMAKNYIMIHNVKFHIKLSLKIIKMIAVYVKKA